MSALSALLCLAAPAQTSEAAAQRLSLHEAVEAALNSPQAQAAEARTDEARGQVKQAGLRPNPRLFLQSEDWRPWDSDYDFGSQTEDYAFVSQTLETAGKRNRRVELGRAQLAQAEAEQRNAQLTLTAGVAAAYYNTVLLRRVAELLEQDMRTVDEMVRYHQQRVNEGAMRGVDLLRMKIERDRLLLALRAAERDAAQAQLELFKQMGRAPSAQMLELTDRLEIAPSSSPAVQPLSVEQVLAQRPDLQVLRAAVKTAESDVALQHSLRVPDLDLVGGYKRNSNVNTGYSALQFDLPFRNRNQGEIERAQAALRYARDTLAAAEVRVRAEVAQREESYQQEQDIVEHVLPDMRANAQQNLSLLTEAYRLGGVDLLRFLDAERTAFEVEVSALRTIADLRQAAVRLQLSYGERP